MIQFLNVEIPGAVAFILCILLLEVLPVIWVRGGRELLMYRAGGRSPGLTVAEADQHFAVLRASPLCSVHKSTLDVVPLGTSSCLRNAHYLRWNDPIRHLCAIYRHKLTSLRLVSRSRASQLSSQIAV